MKRAAFLGRMLAGPFAAGAVLAALSAPTGSTVVAPGGAIYHGPHGAGLAIWDTALTDREVGLLATVSPMYVRPDRLTYYAPYEGYDHSPVYLEASK